MGQDSTPLTEDNWLEKQLGLATLTKSSDEIDLRIFLDRGITNGGHVVHLVKNNGGWTGVKYDYLLKMKKGTVINKIIKTTKTELKSKDWDSLWTKLENLDILILPTQDSIKDKLRKEVTTKRGKGYEVMVVTDGSNYNLNLKKDDKFIRYSFHEPWTYSQKYSDVDEVRKYSEIIGTLEKEFQIKFRQ
ncbi:hypothetical protein [Chryseosolibacter indicus]|uniref:Uncharacterized protein n=1 Tax=Chryseosolibacter indicus TaxID=2782351 RepID=A0ABS5VUP7_9BACT|nr:hypothetical protein [Chryseosolibacter indicus]MBT1705152.1 hypothetical protein [Chryseosolibacter indicus]